jgi:glycosyltransferase involved in cell wall biosynthesis
MFAGCPIVASDVGEVGTALAQGEAGILVEAGDSAALAAALDEVLGDGGRARELGRRAALRAAAEYDISHMVRRYADVYRDLLKTPRGAPRALAALPMAAPRSGAGMDGPA